ncbi:MAG TPA: MarR family transcriptional regulator [Ornithinimicrobium sp.]|uniref:MarR family winged helix-turn-helix transcriptional regulator n=1 Tax=Ornithinimicrobium sp. TaxID=1977084 RepID=UPI002B493BF8|nr:MarR family transcriptional regulator [Ornithinimicrobium sp.]HKJ11460.1 MarR family transcriptional regulator [Ornithinimicrobium sp.]
MTDTTHVPHDDGSAGVASSRQVLSSLRAVVSAMQMYADGVGHDLGLHRSDLMAMNLMSQAAARGTSMTPSQVARSMSMSAAAVTALVDRLERVGHLERHPDPTDRRRVKLDVSRQAEDVSRTMFRPMNDELVEVMSHYTEDELEVVDRMLTEFTRAVMRAREHNPAEDGDSGLAARPPTLGHHATG